MVRAAYISMELITWFVIVPLAFASLLTGRVESLGTPWGLVPALLDSRKIPNHYFCHYLLHCTRSRLESWDASRERRRCPARMSADCRSNSWPTPVPPCWRCSWRRHWRCTNLEA
jgi:hypothetical protein